MDNLPGGGLQPGSRWWSRQSSGTKAGAIVGAIMMLFLAMCSGALMMLGASAQEPSNSPTPAPTESTPAVPAPVATTEVRNVTETQRLPFSVRTIEDPDLRKGVKETRVKGVVGEKTLTYELTFTDGVQTGKRLVKSEVTRAPVTQVVAVGTYEEPESSCDPNYSGCVPIASDVDCAGGKGNGPAYVRGPVDVVGEDIYRLDGDNDGVGCE